MKILEEGSKLPPALLESKEEERASEVLISRLLHSLSKVTDMEKENMNSSKQDINLLTMKSLLDSIPNT